MGTDLWLALCALAVVVLPLAAAGWLVARQEARQQARQQAQQKRPEKRARQAHADVDGK